MPSALASADASSEVNSLLLRWARGLARDHRVRGSGVGVPDGGAPVTRSWRCGSQAGEGLASCALQLGLDAFAANRASVAEQWFVEATQADPSSPAGVRARMGWGDAREAQGDLMGAAIVWQTVVGTPGAPDSLKAQARERINRLAIGRRKRRQGQHVKMKALLPVILLGLSGLPVRWQERRRNRRLRWRRSETTAKRADSLFAGGDRALPGRQLEQGRRRRSIVPC